MVGRAHVTISLCRTRRATRGGTPPVCDRRVVRRRDCQQGSERDRHVVEPRGGADVRLHGRGNGGAAHHHHHSRQPPRRGRPRPRVRAARHRGGPLPDRASSQGRAPRGGVTDGLADPGAGRRRSSARRRLRATSARRQRLLAELERANRVEGRVPRHAVARAADAAQRDPRLRAPAARRGCSTRRAARGRSRRSSATRTALAQLDRRRARRVAHHLRQACGFDVSRCDLAAS